jgi:hypothetical protein
MEKNSLLMVAVLAFASCNPLGTTPGTTTRAKTIFYEDKDYEAITGFLILNKNQPFIPLGTQTIPLEFDLFNPTFENLQVRYIHCNRDWTPSIYPEMEYLGVFNQFDHKSFQYSLNTRVKYVQYQFELVAPRVSGNYLVVVHRRANPNDILYTRRLMVYDRKAGLNAKILNTVGVKDRRTHQQIDVSLSYGQMATVNPMRDFDMRIMQNYEWRTMIQGLTPTLQRPDQSYLEWALFTGENTFPGWNQFRFVDFRTIMFRGQNVVNIQQLENSNRVTLGLDVSRGTQAYAQILKDNNGAYLPWNADPGKTWLESDYAMVHFQLRSEEKIPGEVFVTGRFNNWRLDEQNRMKYDAPTQTYRTALFLKQGFYDYRYTVISKDLPEYHFEGSHFQGENDYYIFVYFRGLGRINDEVVGFVQLNSADFF